MTDERIPEPGRPQPDDRSPWTCGWMAAALVVFAAVVIIVALAQCSAPRSGPDPSTASRHGGDAPMSGATIQGRTGAPADPAVAQSAEHRSQPEATGSDPVRGANVGAPTVSREPSDDIGTAIMSGVLAHMGRAPVPADYAAIPWGRGIRVRICAAHCVTVVSADTGPSLAMQRAGRIADLSVALFVRICGLPASRGVCVGTVEGPVQ